MTITLILAIIAYSISKGMNLFYRLSPQISREAYVRNLDFEGAFQPGLLGFDIAFSVGVPLDPTIGNYSVSQRIEELTNNYDVDGNVVKKKTLIDYHVV